MRALHFFSRAATVGRRIWRGFGRVPGAYGGPAMLKTVEGVYRHGRIDLTEERSDVREETRVLVTFFEANLVDSPSRGVGEAQTAEMRARLATSPEDWDGTEMSIHDHYDATKARQQS